MRCVLSDATGSGANIRYLRRTSVFGCRAGARDNDMLVKSNRLRRIRLA
jgi:hypothetical protein